MKPKKILFISDVGSPWGGSEELWNQAASRLIAEGHSIYVSVGLFGELYAKNTALMNKGAHFFLRKSTLNKVFQKAKTRITALNKIPIVPESFKHISQIKPDLVVLSQSSAYSMYAEMLHCMDLGIRFISVTQLNSEFSWPNDSNFRQIQEANEGAEMNYFVSQGNLDLFHRQLAKKITNVKVISNPYNFDSIKEISWPSEDTYQLAFVGRLDFIHKGIDILLSSFCNAKWRKRNAVLNIYGKGNLEMAKSFIESCGGGNVVFHGHVDGIHKLWEQNHILLMASRYEGMPLSIIEAMFCQRPVVATDVAGHAEYIEEGVSGFIAAAPKIDLFSDALEKAWERRSEWKAMGEKALTHVTEKSSKDPVGVFVREITELV